MDHHGAWTHTLRHNPGVCTPEMGSRHINMGWAEPGCRGVLGDQPSSPGQEGRALPSRPIALPWLHHSAATSGVQVGAGQKVSQIRNSLTLPGSAGQPGGSASVAGHDCPTWGQGLASGKSRGGPLHKSLINNMCYQFPQRLQNASAGGRGLLPTLGAAGWPGHRTSLLLGAAPRPLLLPSLRQGIGTAGQKHPGPSAWPDSPGQAGRTGERGPAALTLGLQPLYPGCTPSPSPHSPHSPRSVLRACKGRPLPGSPVACWLCRQALGSPRRQGSGPGSSPLGTALRRAGTGEWGVSLPRGPWGPAGPLRG